MLAGPLQSSRFHSLDFIIALINAKNRSSPEKLSVIKRYNKKNIETFQAIKEISDYDQKIRFLKEDEKIYSFWKDHLNKNMRNATSHSKTFHNLETGMIESHWHKQENKLYVHFAQECLRTIEILLFNIYCIGRYYPFEVVEK